MKLAVILVAVAVAALQVCNCQPYYNNPDYLDLPTVDKFNEQPHQTIREALLRLELAPDSSVDTITRTLEDQLLDGENNDSSSYNNNISSDWKHVYEALLDSSSETFEDCSSGLNLYLSILAQIKADHHRGLRKFGPFLEHQGLKKFSKCAAIAEERFLSMREPLVSKQLNEVFYKTFGLSANSNKLVLHSQLRTLDLTKNEIKVWKMLRAARQYYEPQRARKDADRFALIKRFMLDRCIRFGEELRNCLTIVSLARYFGFKGFINARLLILNEYHRLCLALIRPETSGRVAINIRRQLSKGPDKIFWDRLGEYAQGAGVRIVVPSYV